MVEMETCLTRILWDIMVVPSGSPVLSSKKKSKDVRNQKTHANQCLYMVEVSKGSKIMKQTPSRIH